MYYNFDKIKKSISLCEFLTDNYGWTFDEGSTSRNPKLRSPETGEVIVIRHSPKGWDTYFSIHDDSIKGATVLDWMSCHIERKTGKKPPLNKVGEILQDFIDSGKTVLPREYGEASLAIDSAASETEGFLYEVKKVKPMTDFTFLESRGIKRETLDDPIWRNVFQQKEFSKNNMRFFNTVVLMYNRNGIAGISQRGVKFKGAIGRRDDSLALSRIINRDVHLFIGESMIDCVSHYQLNKEKGRDMSHAQYLSTEGQITEGQIKYIRDVLHASDSKLKVMRFTPIFDNDVSGLSYTFKLLGNINENGYKYIAQVCGDKIHVIYTTHNPQELSVLFPKHITDMGAFQTEIHSKSGEAITYEVVFPSEKILLKELNGHIGKLNLGDIFSIEIPIHKDFNEDLLQKSDFSK